MSLWVDGEGVAEDENYFPEVLSDDLHHLALTFLDRVTRNTQKKKIYLFVCCLFVCTMLNEFISTTTTGRDHSQKNIFFSPSFPPLIIIHPPRNSSFFSPFESFIVQTRLMARGKRKSFKTGSRFFFFKVFHTFER